MHKPLLTKLSDIDSRMIKIEHQLSSPKPTPSNGPFSGSIDSRLATVSVTNLPTTEVGASTNTVTQAPLVNPSRTLHSCEITGASCAALAAVLRSNCSLLELDLSYNKLGDPGVSLLWEALKHPDTRLQKIRLRKCGITDASCAALAAFLPSNCSLLELDLSQNYRDDAGLSLLCDALKHPDTRLQKIGLGLCAMPNDSCEALAASLRTNRSLLDLDLSDNDLDDAGVSLLCDALKHPDTQLQNINLYMCVMPNDPCAALAAALHFNHYLLELELSNNYVGDADASLICDTLKHPNTRLQKIHLGLCAMLKAPCAALAAALRTNHFLLDLDLSNNDLGDAGATLFWEALKHPDTRLQKINLSDCWITSASCAAQAAFLSSNRSLLDLDLSENKLGDAGATLLWEALKHPDTRLQKISLDNCGITSASCAALATSLRSNRSLLELTLNRNKLGGAGATLLCDALKHPDTRMQKMSLYRCEITGASCAALAAALRSNCSLLELTLIGNYLYDFDLSMIRDALKHSDSWLQKIGFYSDPVPLEEYDEF
ncbi:ribonuclease inhibitor-like [Lissotriton helveticus]